MLLRVQKRALVPSSSTQGRAPSSASLRCYGDDKEVDRGCDGKYGLQTLKMRLQQHTLLLPISADRTPDMQVPIALPCRPTKHTLQLTLKQKRFDLALECLRGLGVPMAGPHDVASHVLCCADEWHKQQGLHRRQQSPLVIDAMQFSLDPPHVLLQMLLP